MKNEGKLKVWLILPFAAILLLTVLFLVNVFDLNQKRQEAMETPRGRALKSGMVASAHPLASEVGVEILRKGGNAVDAAVAAALALGVVEPFASGIGGGGFMLIYMDRDKEVATVDYREMAPLRVTPKMYRDPSGQVMTDRMKEGHLAVAIPGTLAGLTLAPVLENPSLGILRFMTSTVHFAVRRRGSGFIPKKHSSPSR